MDIFVEILEQVQNLVLVFRSIHFSETMRAFYHMGLNTVYLLPIEMFRPVGLFLLYPGKKEQNRRLVGSRCYPEVHPIAFQAVGN